VTIAHTSRAAYESLSPINYMQPKERALMQVFSADSIALTREQLAAALHWKESAVCGRANSLVTKGALEEIDGGKTSSGRAAKLLRLPRGVQGDMFARAA